MACSGRGILKSMCRSDKQTLLQRMPISQSTHDGGVMRCTRVQPLMNGKTRGREEGRFR